MADPASELAQRIDSLVQRIVAHYRPRKVILFGSAARGNYVDTSDVDLIVVAESERTFAQRLADRARVIPDPTWTSSSIRRRSSSKCWQRGAGF